MLNITASEMRSLCIKHEWFTHGTNEQYDRLFEALDTGRPLAEISAIIALCSDEIWDATSVMDALREYEAGKNACVGSDQVTPIVGKDALNEHNADKIEFAKSIDFRECFDRVRSYAKVQCDFARPEIRTSRDGHVVIGFESSDITEQTGAFAPILRWCYLHTFGSAVTTDKETGEMLYWASIDIRYKHKNGGSNGMDVISAQYTQRAGWEFRCAGERQ